MSEPDTVGIPVATVALMGVATLRRQAGLAHDDHTGRAPIDAQPATGADVLVDDEDDVVVWIGAGPFGVRRAGDRAGGEHMDALPRADIDTPLAHDALGLIDVEELLGLDRPRELVDVHLGEEIVAREERKGRGGISTGHCNSPGARRRRESAG